MKLLLDDGNEHVGRHGAPDLRLDCVLAGAQKTLDAQVLLDPLEEQLHLPSVLVQGGNSQCRQACVVGQKYQRLARFWVFESNTAQVFGIVLGDVEAVECNALIADHAGISIGRRRIHAPRIHTPLGAGDKEGAGLMHLVQPSEIQISPIHHIEGTRLDRQDVQYIGEYRSLVSWARRLIGTRVPTSVTAKSRRGELNVEQYGRISQDLAWLIPLTPDQIEEIIQQGPDGEGMYDINDQLMSLDEARAFIAELEEVNDWGKENLSTLQIYFPALTWSDLNTQDY